MLIVETVVRIRREYAGGERRLDVFEYVDVAAAIGLEPITVITKLSSQ